MTDNERYIKAIIDEATELGAVRAMESLGVTSGEISQRKALAVYGKHFADLERAGRLSPCRIESGHAGTRWYKVSDILKAKLADAVRASLR